MNHLISFLIVKPALSALAFVRRHPALSLLALLLCLAIALLWQSVAWANVALGRVRYAILWLEEVPWRKFILFALVAVVPGGLLVLLALRLIDWLARLFSRDVEVKVTEEPSPALFQPLGPNLA